jgi:hypothetical protein
VIGLGNSSYQVSASMGLLLVVLVGFAHGTLGISNALPWGFAVIGGLALVGAIGSLILTPGKEEFYDKADSFLGFPSPRDRPPFLRPFKEAFDVMRQKPLETTFYALSGVTCYIQLLYWFAFFYPYLSTLFKPTLAKEMADSGTPMLIFSDSLCCCDAPLVDPFHVPKNPGSPVSFDHLHNLRYFLDADSRGRDG